MTRALAIVLLLGVVCAAQDPPTDEKKMPKFTNRLAKEKSPYLLQHAHNPVDWFPWGQEAFDKAKKEDKPIFLSIGYSTCHWCHVMEHESFENEEVAKVLNGGFVAIKVDREERPDVDQIYMAAVQALGERGGWPLSAWLTPDLKPFYGATYFPRDHFVGQLKKILEVWKEKREEIDTSAKRLAEHLQKEAASAQPGDVKIDSVLEIGFDQIGKSYEPVYGGFSRQPKFPHSTTIQFLLRAWKRTGSKEALQMAEKSLEQMALGGLYDQLGGGFHRYSTDSEWLVPHFEKMLYDNALLASAYLEAYLVTRKEFYARIARETLDYVLRDMTSKDGGFYSAEDADSEGIEGKFYVWNPRQVAEVLGEAAPAFGKAFDVTVEGNWVPHEASIPRNQSVLHLARPLDPAGAGSADLAAHKRKLFEARAARVRPHLDDKVLTGWNALMIGAMAQASQILGEARYREAAERAAKFLLERHRKDGRLLRTSRLGEAKLDAYLEDYSYLAAAMLDLYEATFDGAYFLEAEKLAGQAIEQFWDDAAGGFFTTAKGHASLIARMREEYEGPHPTGNSVMTMTLLKLFSLTGKETYRERAGKTVKSMKAELERYPAGHAWMLCALDYMKGPAREIVIAGPDPAPLLQVVRGLFLPNKVVAVADGKAKIPLLEDRGPVKGKAAAYVCENMTCQRPVTEPSELEALLKK